FKQRERYNASTRMNMNIVIKEKKICLGFQKMPQSQRVLSNNYRMYSILLLIKLGSWTIFGLIQIEKMEMKHEILEIVVKGGVILELGV
ncbi:hypothetical protein ACJX0J_010836, partial [Zea mays]